MRVRWASLTPIELEVATLATAGLGSHAIASQLLITEGAVRTHLRHVFAKLGVRTRAELAATVRCMAVARPHTEARRDVTTSRPGQLTKLS